MEKWYESPEMEVIRFEDHEISVSTTSGDDIGGGDVIDD